MRLPISLLLLAWPLAEIAGFVAVGRLIGVLPTIALVIATSLLGSLMLRIQGLGALARIGEEVRAGRNPGREMAHGVMIAMAGLLLLLPGFLSDLAGLLLFIPPVRELGWRLLRSRLGFVARFSVFSSRTGGRGDEGQTIDLSQSDYSEVQRPQARLRRIDPERG